MAVNMLIVDDSAIMRKMIVKTLRLVGPVIGRVHEAGDGKEALGVLEENWIDIVLTDLNMPVMDGEEMIDRIREHETFNGMPIIVVSTEGSQPRIDGLKRKGAAFIHKPFTPEIVRDVLKDMTGVSV